MEDIFSIHLPFWKIILDFHWGVLTSFIAVYFLFFWILEHLFSKIQSPSFKENSIDFEKDLIYLEQNISLLTKEQFYEGLLKLILSFLKEKHLFSCGSIVFCDVFGSSVHDETAIELYKKIYYQKYSPYDSGEIRQQFLALCKRYFETYKNST